MSRRVFARRYAKNINTIASAPVVDAARSVSDESLGSETASADLGVAGVTCVIVGGAATLPLVRFSTKSPKSGSGDGGVGAPRGACTFQPVIGTLRNPSDSSVNTVPQ